jgi:hypothetical protein
MTLTHTPVLARRLLLTGALALLLVSLAQAQQAPPGGFRMPTQQQQLANQPGSQTQLSNVQPTVYPQGNFNYNPYMYGGMGYPGFGGIYYPGQVGGALQGVAAVTTANAQYQGTIQDARLQKSYANQAGLDYRKKAIEEWKYEQQFKQTPEDIAAIENAQALRRARENATQTEIWDGSTLNTLLGSIRKMQLGGLRGPMIPLDQQMLRHIHLTDGTTGGNVGLLGNGGELEWPLVLQTRDFADNRKKIDDLCQQAVQQASRSGKITADTLFALIDAVNALRTKVDGAVTTLAPTPYIQASRYVKELNNTVKALQDPNTVRKQFSGQWMARGNTVSELVSQIIDKGLKFGPAAPGDETFYTSLYNSMLSYDMGLYQVAYAGSPGGGPQR